MALHFRVASAHIDLFELPRTSVWGRRGQTGASLDMGTTLEGSSCENIGLTSGICAFSLIVLVLVAIGKSDPVHFSQSSRGKKNSVIIIEISRMYFDTSLKTSRRDYSDLSSPGLLSRNGIFFQCNRGFFGKGSKCR
jgi:hypothetical protein